MGKGKYLREWHKEFSKEMMFVTSKFKDFSYFLVCRVEEKIEVTLWGRRNF